MKEIIRYLTGYILGFTVFIVLIPLGFIKLSNLDYLFPSSVLISSDPLRYIVSSLFLLAGIYFALWSNIFLLKIGKGGPVDAFGVSVSPQTKKLVTTGPYRYCRNPMVFGALSIYTAVVFYLNSIIGLICLVVFLIGAINYLKLSEEKRLLRDFGDEYVEYKKRVSMIFPLKRKKIINRI